MRGYASWGCVCYQLFLSNGEGVGGYTGPKIMLYTHIRRGREEQHILWGIFLAFTVRWGLNCPFPPLRFASPPSHCLTLRVVICTYIYYLPALTDRLGVVHRYIPVFSSSSLSLGTTDYLRTYQRQQQSIAIGPVGGRYGTALATNKLQQWRKT